MNSMHTFFVCQKGIPGGRMGIFVATIAAVGSLTHIIIIKLVSKK